MKIKLNGRASGYSFNRGYSSSCDVFFDDLEDSVYGKVLYGQLVQKLYKEKFKETRAFFNEMLSQIEFKDDELYLFDDRELFDLRLENRRKEAKEKEAKKIKGDDKSKTLYEL